MPWLRTRTEPDARGVQAFFLAYATATCCFLAAAIPLSWLDRGFGSFRNSQIALNVAALAAMARWWTPGAASASFRLPRSLLYGTAIAGAALFLACQVSRFYSLTTSGFDFSIFDRMLYNTNHGRFGYSPIYDVNHFGVHGTYILLALAPIQRLVETPLLLVIVTAIILWLGVLPLWQLAVRYLESESQAFLVLVAYLTNPWIGRLLDGGFRPENFYPVLGLTLVWGWVQNAPQIWFPSLIGFLCIKEDAAFYIAALGVAALLLERKDWQRAAACVALSLMMLALNLAFLQPMFLAETGAVRAGYLRFWGQYGTTLGEIAARMLASPLRVAKDVLTSGWYKLFAPALFTPLLSKLPMAAMAPALFLLGSASYPAMRQYQAYYAVPLIPFFFWGLLEGYRALGALRRFRHWRDGLFAAALLLFPIVGGGYIRFHWPDRTALQGLRQVLQQVDGTRSLVCAQAILFPHLPYQWRAKPLDPSCIREAGAVTLINPLLDPFPYTRSELEDLLTQAEVHQRAQKFEGGFALLTDPTPELGR